MLSIVSSSLNHSHFLSGFSIDLTENTPWHHTSVSMLENLIKQSRCCAIVAVKLAF